jgi:hypothetical protein
VPRLSDLITPGNIPVGPRGGSSSPLFSLPFFNGGVACLGFMSGSVFR